MVRFERTRNVTQACQTPEGDATSNDAPSTFEEPSTAVNATSLTSLLLLVERQKREQAKAADRRADAAEVAEDRAQKAVVDAMRREAEHAFQKGVVSGLATIGAGAVQVAGAGLSVAGRSAPAAIVTSSRDVVKGAGDLLATLPESAAKQDLVERAQAENEAKFAERTVKREGDFAKVSQDLAAQTLQRLESLLQAHQQSISALLQRA